MAAWAFAPWNLNEDVRLRGIRLLVVAESHYKERGCTDAFDSTETSNVVQNNAPGFAPGAGSRFFKTVADLLACEQTPRERVWSQIYFYNYFQRPFETPGERPSAKDYADGVVPFDAVLRRLSPDAVLVTSARLWHGMGNEAARDPSYFDGDGLDSVYRFTGGAGLSVQGAHTWHPSARRRFLLDYWRPRVARYLSWIEAGMRAA